jgi:hypothetical protein
MFYQTFVRCVAVCIVVVMVFAFGPVYGSLAVISVLFGILCLNKPLVLLVAYFAFASVSGYMLVFLRSPLVGLLDEAFTVAILCIWIAHGMIQRHLRMEDARFLVVTLLLLVVVFLSFLVNRSSPFGMLHYALTYLSFIPIFLMVREFWSPSRIGSLSLWIILIMVVQVVLSLGWLAGINPLPNPRHLWVDRGIGTFGNSSYLGYLCVACISVLLNLGERSLSLHLRIARLMGLAVLGLMFFLTFTIHAYPALLTCCVWWARAHYLRHKRNPIYLIMVAAIIGSVLAVAVIESETIRRKSSSMRYLERNKAISIWDSVSSSPKGIAYRGFLKEVPRQLPFPVLGAGPGNGGSLVASDRQTPLANRYINYVYETISGQMMIATGSILVTPHAGFLAIYSDIGLLGCLLYYGLHLMAIIRIWRLYKLNKYVLFWQKSLAYSMIPVVVWWLLLSSIVDVFHFDFLTSSLWGALALVWLPYKNEDRPEVHSISEVNEIGL